MNDTDEGISWEEAQRLVGEEQKREAQQTKQGERRSGGDEREFFLEEEFQAAVAAMLYHSDIKGDEVRVFYDVMKRFPPNRVFDEPPPEVYYRYADVITELSEMAQAYVVARKREQAEHAARKVYAFSLTTPERDAAAEVCEAAQKLFEQQSVPIAEGVAYLEHGKSGLPHIHGWYSTEHGGRVFAKVFKRCWPQWGEDRKHHTKFRGGYHELVKNPAAYTLYAAAEQALVVRKQKSQPLVYGSPPSSSSSEAQAPTPPQETPAA